MPTAGRSVRQAEREIRRVPTDSESVLPPLCKVNAGYSGWCVLESHLHEVISDFSEVSEQILLYREVYWEFRRVLSIDSRRGQAVRTEETR